MSSRPPYVQDYVSNNCKQNHSKISNSSTTKIEPKAKKLRDLENESFNSEHQVQKAKVHKEVNKKHDKNILKDVDIFSIEDNVVGNHYVDPSSNDNLNFNKRKDAKVTNYITTNVKTKKTKILDGDLKKRNNHTKKSKRGETKLKNVDMNNDLDLASSSNCSVNKKNHSEVSNSSSSAIMVPQNKICYDIVNETISGNDQVKKVKEDKINENKKLVDEELNLIKDNIVHLDDYVKQVEDVDVVYKETSKSVVKDLDKDNVDDYQLLSSKTDTSNENWSSESTSSPTSNHRIESDDGQTTDDDQYVKNRKVTKNKRKDKIDAEDRNIFEQFGCEKPYSRAAKVKATEAISSQMKKPSGKKNDGKRLRNGRKKDEEDLSNACSNLADYNLTLTNHCQTILLLDNHAIQDYRYITILPAKLTVYMILHDYASKNEVNMDLLEEVLFSFDLSLRMWLLHPIERLKYYEVLAKYPGKKVHEIYGLPHLFRFIVKLPKLFEIWGDIEHSFISDVVKFAQGLIVYLDKEQFSLTLADYDCIMPDYYRMSFSY